MTKTVLFAGGPLASGRLEKRRPDGGATGATTARLRDRVNAAAPDLMIAADSGLDFAAALGFRPDVVIGDMDSVSDAALRRAVESGAEIEVYDTDKDATDFELGLLAAMRAGTTELLVVGSDSGRLDHLFATITTLASEQFRSLLVEAWLGDNHLIVIHGNGPDPEPRALQAGPGSVVSILAFNGTAQGVSTTGLRWPLTDESLSPGSSRGVSNEFIADMATVQVQQGCVVIVLPDPKEK